MTKFYKAIINAAQFRQQLILDGKDELVLSVIESIPDETQRKLIKARYEYEVNFMIDDPDLLLLAGKVGYDTPEKIAKFFENASRL